VQNHHPILRFCSLVVMLLSASTGHATDAHFTLAQVLGAPFASDLVADDTGRSIAWASNSRGARNVWSASLRADGTMDQRALTHYTTDDGLEIGDITFIPHRQLVAFVRGGDLEFPDKPAANPASRVDGVEQEVFLAAVRGGQPVKVGAGHSPVASPSGDRLIFLKDGVAYTTVPHPGAKPEVLFKARGAVETPRFSPDGSRLAFTSQRGDHSFVGVYTFKEHTLRWLDASFALDMEPTWSPDGRQVAFLRLPSPHPELGIGPHRTGTPWSIRIAAVDGSSVRELYRAPQGVGSVFHPIASEHQLMFVGESLIFPSEADGWTHLYAIPRNGGSATRLTPGAFEVEWAVGDAKNDRVVFSSNSNDPDRRHLSAVEPSTGRVSTLTSGEGIETSPIALADGRLAFLSSDAYQPMHAAVLHDGQTQALWAEGIPADFPGTGLIKPESITLPMRAGHTAHGQLFLPVGGSGRHPALIFMHGGPVRQMLAGWHYMGYYSNAYAMNQYLASRGYVVLALNYRAGIGYGFDFREAERFGAQGASEYNDLLSAAEYLRSRSDVDSGKIGLWGGSYGGYMTALGLARNSDLFAAGVDLHGVHDWYNWSLGVRDRAVYYPPDIPSEALSIAWSSSPMADVDHWQSPVLLIHGDDDHNVRFDETVRLARALSDRGIDYSELVFPDEIHGFLRHESWLKAYGTAAIFLDSHLK